MNPSQIEQALAEQYDLQNKNYHEAAALLATTKIKTTDDYDVVSVQLQKVVSKISEQEARLAGLREQWNNTGGRPSDHLQETMNNVATSLRTTISLIDEAAQRMQKSKERLRPELNEVAKQAKMRSAYGDSAH